MIANEKFSGKGHSHHICKKCFRLSKEYQQKRIDENYVCNILHQKNISRNNINRLIDISKKYTGELSDQTKILIKVGELHPQKKKRNGFLYHKHRDVFDELVRFGFIQDYIIHRIQDEREYERWLESNDINENITEEIDEIEYNEDDELPF